MHFEQTFQEVNFNLNKFVEIEDKKRVNTQQGKYMTK